jgi:hypothetical protein
MFCSSPPCRGHLHLLLSLFPVFDFFEAIVNGIVFLYSFSICSLLEFRKATEFCKLILYPATLLKLFMKFFGSFRYKIVSSTNRIILTTSLPICIPFCFFFLPYFSG